MLFNCLISGVIVIYQCSIDNTISNEPSKFAVVCVQDWTRRLIGDGIINGN